MKGKEVVFVPFSRYEALFKYTVEPNGSVTVMFLDEDGNANDVEDGLLYEDGKLVTLNGDFKWTDSHPVTEKDR